MRSRTRFLATVLIAAVVPAAIGLAAAAKPKLDPESAKFFQTARLIMTKEEVKIFERLPDAESRKDFIADFWLKRDPDPDTPDNEYRKEFEARVEYVNKRFNKEGGPAINTDRGRIYIFMGPPDKTEEFSPQPGSTVRGFTIWWSYYEDRMAVQFIDETGGGKYRLTDVEGDFWGAMDLMKMGRYVRADDVFSKKFVKFDASYDAKAGEIEVRLPVKGLMLRENDEGQLQIDLRFLIYVYTDEGLTKETFEDARTTVLTDAELEGRKTLDYRFAKPLKPGTNYVDVIVMGKEGMKGKIRQIFEVKVPRG